DVFEPEPIPHQQRLIKAILPLERRNYLLGHPLVTPFHAETAHAGASHGTAKAHLGQLLLDRAARCQVNNHKADQGDSEQSWQYQEEPTEKVQAHGILVALPTSPWVVSTNNPCQPRTYRCRGSSGGVRYERRRRSGC